MLENSWDRRRLDLTGLECGGVRRGRFFYVQMGVDDNFQEMYVNEVRHIRDFEAPMWIRPLDCVNPECGTRRPRKIPTSQIV